MILRSTMTSLNCCHANAVPLKPGIFTLWYIARAWLLMLCSKEAIFCIMEAISSISLGADPKGTKSTDRENNLVSNVLSRCQPHNGMLCSLEMEHRARMLGMSSVSALCPNPWGKQQRTSIWVTNGGRLRRCSYVGSQT